MLNKRENNFNIVFAITVCVVICIALIVMPSLSVTYSNAKYTSSAESNSSANVANIKAFIKTPQDNVVFEKSEQNGTINYGSYMFMIGNCSFNAKADNNGVYKATDIGEASETAFRCTVVLKVSKNITVGRLYHAGNSFLYDTTNSYTEASSVTTDATYAYYTFDNVAFSALSFPCSTQAVRFFVIEMYSNVATGSGVTDTSLTVTATQID